MTIDYGWIISYGMKIIRPQVFETNSSSCHSLVVNDHGDYTSITPSEDGLIYIRAVDFGWSHETFSSPEDKLSYVAIYLRDWTTHRSDRDVMEGTLNRVVLDHTGAIGLIFPDNSDWNGGYIDHQSVECHDLDYLFEDDAVMKAFIFDRSSYVTTDNDNH